ncbi:MAG: NBR1-Ig-like domain-containing protein [Anaerolineae bacterium]
MTNSRTLLSIIFYVSVAILMSACQGEDLANQLPSISEITPLPTQTRQPSPTPWPTATTFPTATLPPEPTPTPDLTATWVAENVINLDSEFSAEGITFTYSEVLLQNIVPSRELPRVDGLRTLDTEALILSGVPDHLVFRGESSQPTSRPPMLVVQSIVDETGFFYPAYEISDQEYFNELRRVSITRPSLSFFFSRDDFVIGAEYHTFANGKGISAIRYLPSSDNPQEITNRQLFYTYEGISDSGDFYIWFQYPVQALALPDQETFTENQLSVLAANEDNFSIYKINEMEQVRRSLEDGEIKPGREILDELVSTIFVADTAGGRVATAGSAEATPVNTPLPQDAEIPAVEPSEMQESDSVPIPTASIAVEEPTEVEVPTEEATVVAATPTLEPTLEPTPIVAPESTPTPEPEPTATSTEPPPPTDVPQTGAVPTYDPSCANFLVYLADVTIPDNTVIEAGTEFEKTWRVENKGSCDITPEFEMVTFGDPEVTVVRTIPIETIEAGGSGLISIVLRAPNEAGKYDANVKLRAPDGEEFGQLFVIFIVE